jgi:hypothetical protein
LLDSVALRFLRLKETLDLLLSVDRRLLRPTAALGLLLLGSILLRLLELPQAEIGRLLNDLLFLVFALLLFSSISLAVRFLRRGIVPWIVVCRQVVQAREQRGYVLHASVLSVFI